LGRADLPLVDAVGVVMSGSRSRAKDDAQARVTGASHGQHQRNTSPAPTEEGWSARPPEQVGAGAQGF